MIRAVIIDLDDTLVMPRESSYTADNEVLDRLGLSPVSRQLHDEHWGKYAEEAVQHWAPGVDLNKFRVIYEQVIMEYVRAGKLDVIPTENLKILDKLLASGKELYTRITH